MNAIRFFAVTIAFLAAGSLSQALHAAEFPTRTVRMIVPTGAGGGLDAVGRLVAQKLAELWGQGVFVENRVGAGGTIGIDAIAKAPPDGYTIGVVATSFVINASVYSKLPYDSLRDFAPITLVSLSPLVLVANPSLPARSVGELVALAKANPGKLNYSSTGVGGGVHLSMEMLRDLAGIDIVHVPYKSTVAAVTDVISGVVQFTTTGLPVAMPMISAGKLRALAIAGNERSPALPDLPTIKESLPGYVFNNWIGVLAPANTPKDILARLHEGVAKVMQSEDLKQTMQAQGDVPMTMTSTQFSDLINTEIQRYQTLVKSIGVSID